MEIRIVSVCYGELRSTGYPNFSNKRFELTLTARLENGETAKEVKEQLFKAAEGEVKKFFGDTQPDPSDILAAPHRGHEELDIK